MTLLIPSNIPFVYVYQKCISRVSDKCMFPTCEVWVVVHHGVPVPSQHRDHRRQLIQLSISQVLCVWCDKRRYNLSITFHSLKYSSYRFWTFILFGFNNAYTSFVIVLTHNLSIISHSHSFTPPFVTFKIFTIWFDSACTGFGMVLPHRKAAVFTARRFELLDVVQSTLTYLHPDSRVHSFLSPLPYQVSHNLKLN